MMILLKYLSSSIYTGFTIRESVEHIDYGDVKILQIKDLPRVGKFVDIDTATPIEWRYDSKPQFLSHNSIVIISRGEPSAYLFKGDQSDKVVVSNMSIVVNLATQDLLPEYLVWYINNASQAQQHFKINARGSAINLTTINAIRELPVIIPSIEEQEHILQLEQEAQREKQNFETLIALRQEHNIAQAEQILAQTHTPTLQEA